MTKSKSLMKINYYLISFLAIFSFSWFFTNTLFAVCISVENKCETPSDCGGKNLYIENNTSFAIKIPDVTWFQGNNEPEFIVNAHGKKTLSHSYKVGPTEFCDLWGIPGQKSGGLNIYSADNRWPDDKQIIITLEKGKSNYVKDDQFIEPIKDSAIGCCMPRIYWEVHWNGDGWKIQLREEQISTGSLDPACDKGC